MKKKGFTLIELMVTVTIMMIMTAVVLFNYNQFNENTLLSGFAYDLSLTIRQAQVYGVATRQGVGDQSAKIDVNNFGGNKFSSAYGVHFDSETNPPLRLFADLNTSYTFDSNEELQSYFFQRDIKIESLCVKTESPLNCTYTKLDILFKRPNPEAIITTDSGSIVESPSYAKIVLRDGDGDVRKTVTVYSTGQISVQ